MKRLHKSILAVIIIGFIIGGIFIIEPFGLTLAGFYWNVDIGESYQYTVEVEGDENYGSYWFEDDILPFNGTTLNVTVSYLPTLGNVFTKSQFTNNIINSVKVNVTFSNGTALTVWGNETLIPAISGCILPCGAWTTIDFLYPDTLAGLGLTSRATILHEDYFEIAYQRLGMDDNRGWRGHVSLTTGVPSSIVWHYSHMYSTIYVRMTLVE